MDVKPARIRLHIEELIVNGVTVGDRDALGDAIRRELARLLTAQALPSALSETGHIPSLDAGAVQVASPQGDSTSLRASCFGADSRSGADLHAHALGIKVAQAVHGSFRRQDPA